MFASKHSCHDIPARGIRIHCIPIRGHSRHGILSSRHSHHGILSRRHCIHCKPKRAFAFTAYPSGHSHSLHTQVGIRIHCIPTRGHSRHGILPSRHSHHCIPTWINFASAPLHGTSASWKLHLWKETCASYGHFASASLWKVFASEMKNPD